MSAAAARRAARAPGRGAVALLLAVAIPAASPAHAQREPTVTLDCRPGSVLSLTAEEVGDRWARYHPPAVLASVRPLADSGRWGAALHEVTVRALEGLERAPAHRAAVAARIRETSRLFDSLTRLPAARQPEFMAAVVKPAQWEPTQNPVTGNVTVFAGTEPIVLTEETPSEVRRAVCWPAIAMRGLLTMYDAPVRDETVRELTALASRWERYAEHSYSQLPWELALNSLSRSRRDWEPPRRQWILLHPSVGLEAAGLRRQELQRVDVAVLEALGLLFYNGDYSRYVGVSAVGTFASDRPPGIGGYLHLWFPQAKLGYVRRPAADASRRHAFLVSVDLYDLLTGVPRGLTEAKDAALARAAGGVR